MLASAYGLKSHEGYLHGQNRAQHVKHRVGNVNTVREATNDHEHEHVQGYEIYDENVASPCGHHVKVGQGGEYGPEYVACFHALDPQVVGEHEGEYGDALVVVGARHTATYVAGHDADKSGREQARTLTPQLFGEEVGGDGGQTAEKGRQKHAHLCKLK